MIIVDNISKYYNKNSIAAVDSVSFEVKKGELFGLIGPDGAGKTSTFRMLATLLLPDSGSASINGYDVVKSYKKLRKLIGYMPGRFSLYQDLSVEENLSFFATLFNTGIEENYDLIKDIYTQIEPFKKRRAGKLSGGMKQKLALCCALIHKPEVLILDEPTTGVDPVSRKEFWEMLKHLKSLGITILVSTPYMDEAILCDRIALMQKGKILSIDTPQKLIKDYRHNLYAVQSNDMYFLLKNLSDCPFIMNSYAFGESVHVVMTKNPSEEAINQIKSLRAYLLNAGNTDISIKMINASVEDCFIGLMTEKEALEYE